MAFGTYASTRYGHIEYRHFGDIHQKLAGKPHRASRAIAQSPKKFKDSEQLKHSRMFWEAKPTTT
jgi:hypothetical protein